MRAVWWFACGIFLCMMAFFCSRSLHIFYIIYYFVMVCGITEHIYIFPLSLSLSSFFFFVLVFGNLMCRFGHWARFCHHVFNGLNGILCQPFFNYNQLKCILSITFMGSRQIMCFFVWPSKLLAVAICYDKKSAIYTQHTIRTHI